MQHVWNKTLTFFQDLKVLQDQYIALQDYRLVLLSIVFKVLDNFYI